MPNPIKCLGYVAKNDTGMCFWSQMIELSDDIGR